jgi:lambda family phage portal protein
VSWIDSAISIISPSWAASRGNARLAARAAAARLEAYETFNRFNSNRWGRVGRTAHDAAKKTREVADWYTDAYSADAAIIPELRDINARARASVRNDWAARSIVDGYRRHVVGTGITCRSDARDPATGEFLHDFNRALDEAWCAWADNPARCDIEGRKTLVEIQGMMIDEWVTVGESFLVEHWTQGGLLLQVLEPEQLDSTFSENRETGNSIRGGVEIDTFGRAVAYWFHSGDHPLETYDPKPVRIPADRVRHLFRQERPRQTRGLSRLAPVLTKLRNLDAYQRYQIIRAKVEACIGLLITRNVVDPNTDEFVGVNVPAGDDAADGNNNPFYNLEPGMVERLEPGESIEAFDPKAPGTTYEPFVNHHLHQIAAGVGLDYPTVARDFTNGSFSAQREGHLERDKETDLLQKLMIDTVLQPMRRGFVLWAVQSGRVQAPPSFYRPETHESFQAADWQPPLSRGLIRRSKRRRRRSQWRTAYRRSSAKRTSKAKTGGGSCDKWPRLRTLPNRWASTCPSWQSRPSNRLRNLAPRATVVPGLGDSLAGTERRNEQPTKKGAHSRGSQIGPKPNGHEQAGALAAGCAFRFERGPGKRGHPRRGGHHCGRSTRPRILH